MGVLPELWKAIKRDNLRNAKLENFISQGLKVLVEQRGEEAQLTNYRFY